MLMLGLNEAIDQLATANSLCLAWSCVENGEWSCVEGGRMVMC